MTGPSPGGTELLRATGLTKRYGDRTVVDDLDLEVHEAEVLGLLGPNGAGKTTTLRMLYGFATPDAGQIRYEGRDFAAERTAVKRIVGVCTQEDTLDYDFSVRQNLSVYASYFRPAVEDLRSRVEGLLEEFGLAPYANASPHALSGGFKRRLLIARSIVHRPRVLFLDEPTTGLDPAARVDVWELVARLREEGMGIILTTHYMDEAERLSDRLLVLREGRGVAHGDTEEVLGSFLGEHILVLPEDGGAEGIRELLHGWQVRTSTVLGEIHAPISAGQLAELTARFPDARLTIRPPTLDDLFLDLARPAA
ncbi:MAG: ABC transporter ATP-binding protein [Sandaracinaceae bacterium]